MHIETNPGRVPITRRSTLSVPFWVHRKLLKNNLSLDILLDFQTASQHLSDDDLICTVLTDSIDLYPGYEDENGFLGLWKSQIGQDHVFFKKLKARMLDTSVVQRLSQEAIDSVEEKHYATYPSTMYPVLYIVMAQTANTVFNGTPDVLLDFYTDVLSQLRTWYTLEAVANFDKALYTHWIRLIVQ